jgi:hypothetical protein
MGRGAGHTETAPSRSRHPSPVTQGRLPLRQLRSLQGVGLTAVDRRENGHGNAYQPFLDGNRPMTRPGALRAVFDSWEHTASGYRLTVTEDRRADAPGDWHSIFFKIHDRNGVFVGDAGRQFFFDEHGRAVVNHGTLFIYGKQRRGRVSPKLSTLIA